MERNKQLHDNILSDLHEVTMQYVNVPDPTESAARRQRVLDGEMNNLMAETAASMLASALQSHGQLQIKSQLPTNNLANMETLTTGENDGHNAEAQAEDTEILLIH